MKKHILAVVLTLLLLAATGCAPGGTSAPAPAREIVGSMELAYATQFSVDYYADGTAAIRVADGREYRLIPEGADLPESLAPEVTLLRLPLDRVYLAASSAMDSYRQLDALEPVLLTSTKSTDWSLPAVRSAMEAGSIGYAGKYNAPDYELLLSLGTNLAVESTMIYHSPETLEQLEGLGIPVLVERSSYEAHPLGRMEWIKLYGLLAGRAEEAEAYFNSQRARAEQAAESQSTGKTVAFFYINSGGSAVVRRPGDYISKMIEMAGGVYVPADLGDGGSTLSTLNMQMEDFYAAARDADLLIYNSTVDGELESLDQLLKKSEVLKNFKAVQQGNVWCTGKNMFQQTTGAGDMIADFSAVLSGRADPSQDLVYLYPLS